MVQLEFRTFNPVSASFVVPTGWQRGGDNKRVMIVSPTRVGLLSKTQAPLLPTRRIVPSSSRCYAIATTAPLLKLLPTIPFSGPLIPAHSDWGNWAALMGLACLSQHWGRTTTVGRLLGAPVTAMALTFLCASIGILNPGGTEAAQSLQLLSLQIATPLILLAADLRWSSLKRCGPLLLTFMTAATATFVASCVGWKCGVGAALSKVLFEGDGLKIAAALLAKNIGGGVNYIAVARSLNASASAVAAGLCVDNLFALIYFPVTSALARGREDIVKIEKKDDTTLAASSNSDDNNDPKQECSTDYNSNETSTTMTVQSITAVLFLASALLWLGELLGGPSGAQLPACTILTVLLASTAPPRRMQSLRPTAGTLGLVALYSFFATAGAPGLLVADESVKASLAPLTAFLASLYSLHAALLWMAYKFVGPQRFRGAFAAQRLLVASSAAIGGPATAVTLASTAEWPSLTVPSILVGNVGYAIATFCGLGFYRMMVR